MSTLQIGHKVKYHIGDEKWQTGKIHGIRKMDSPIGEQVVAYLVDTGKKNKLVVDKYHPETGAWTGSHEEDTDQPTQVDVRPDHIEPL